MHTHKDSIFYVPIYFSCKITTSRALLRAFFEYSRREIKLQKALRLRRKLFILDKNNFRSFFNLNLISNIFDFLYL